MDTIAPDNSVTQRLARWAAIFLASSMVLSFALLFLWFTFANLPTWAADHPVGTTLLVLFVAGYAVSFVCLHKIQRPGNHASTRLWVASLIGCSTPLLVLAYSFGPNSAILIIGMAEVAAVVLHIIAIAIILKRLSPPNTSLERTRGR